MDQMRHPAWCNQNECNATATGGEHIGTRRSANPAGDEYVSVHLRLIGNPGEAGLPVEQSVYVELTLMQEDVTTSYLLEIAQGQVLGRNLRELTGAVTAA